MKIIKLFFGLFVFALFSPVFLRAQSSEIFTLTDEALKGDSAVELNKLPWKYHAGDDAAWAARDFDDVNWARVEDTSFKQESLMENWQGRAWFRLHLQIDENLVGKTLALAGTQRGAAYVYLDGRKIAEFGLITDSEISEYNPGKLPIPFKFETAGEHVLAVRFASNTFADLSSGKSQWLINGGIYPSFSYSISSAEDVAEIIGEYAFQSSMRIGFFFVGVLLALALLHFLLYIFYLVERANLFYSIYAASFGLFVLFNNLISFGHQPVFVSVVLRIIATLMLATTFIGLIAFLHVVFGRRIGKVFWIFIALWAISSVIGIFYLNNAGKYQIFTNITIGLTFTFCILILVNALREKRSGAWIVMIGVQLLMLGMTLSLFEGLKVINLNEVVSTVSQLAIILSVPIAVSVFLARNFARTNRDLKTQLAQIETLSAQKIEQEKQSAELRAENERRAKELEEARQLQLSMLPNKLPQLPNLEIAAYMKPATEVGGDYYDFHVSKDGTLTVVVGDATGHGLKAGSVVTATKSLFNAFAEQKNIPQIFMQTSGALKKMNLRGLFMAMAMLKIKDGVMTLCVAGMPSVLIYRAESKTVDEISLRAMPLGSITKTVYIEREISLGKGDCVVLMSDGFPEMFNPANEMLGFDKAAELLPAIAANSPQEIINYLIKVSDDWANGRAADDDVTLLC